MAMVLAADATANSQGDAQMLPDAGDISVSDAVVAQMLVNLHCV